MGGGAGAQEKHKGPPSPRAEEKEKGSAVAVVETPVGGEREAKGVREARMLAVSA